MRLAFAAAGVFSLQAAEHGQPLSDAQAAPKYVITDLGTLGGLSSTASGINNSGQVVGYSVADNGKQHAFRTAPNSPINPATDDLGTLGFGSSRAYGINSLGQVVGSNTTDLYPYSPHAFRTMPNSPINPATDDLGNLGLPFTEGYAINDFGQVVGRSLTRFGYFHAFRTGPDSPVNPAADDLGTLGSSPSPYSVACGINNSGQVAGSSNTPADHIHAFRTAPNSPIDAATDNLGPVAERESSACGINDAGQVAGTVNLASGIAHAFRTAANNPINLAADDLGTLGGVPSFAASINNSGQVVGGSRTSQNTFHPFVYSGGVMLDLNDLIPTGLGWELQSASHINDVGQIVGVGLHNGQTRAFRLDPILDVAIAIKPGEDPPRINPRSSGKIPVAILSSSSFNAPDQIDQMSLTFGRTGDEQSLAFCSGPDDVNQDGLPDLVCHFHTPLTGFQTGDTEGVLKGKIVNGLPFTGTDSVRITH